MVNQARALLCKLVCSQRRRRRQSNRTQQRLSHRRPRLLKTEETHPSRMDKRVTVGRALVSSGSPSLPRLTASSVPTTPASQHSSAVTRQQPPSTYQTRTQAQRTGPAARGVFTALDVCMKVVKGEQRNLFEDDENVHDPKKIPDRVQIWIQRWGRVAAVHPQEFLVNILRHRGYDSGFLEPGDLRPPSEKQVQDYDNALVWAIRNSDLAKLTELHSTGRSMTACNQFSESIVHIACRRSSASVVQFLLTHGADITIRDDYGRTPLHDACWRTEPNFEIVAMLLDRNLDLIRCEDVRRNIPLHYVRTDHWLPWCAFLFNQIEKYWAPRTPSSSVDGGKENGAVGDKRVLPPESDRTDSEQSVHKRVRYAEAPDGSSLLHVVHVSD